MKFRRKLLFTHKVSIVLPADIQSACNYSPALVIVTNSIPVLLAYLPLAPLVSTTVGFPPRWEPRVAEAKLGNEGRPAVSQARGLPPCRPIL